jgi:site-specific DNA recombinase
MRLIRCGTCGCAITTTVKKKFIKKTKEFKYFTYHHCTHRRGNCNEKPVTDEDLKGLLYNLVGETQIDNEVWQLGIQLVREKYKAEVEKNKNRHYYFSHEQQRIRDRIQKLIDMRANEELTKEEFLQQKEKFLNQLASFENKAKDSNQSLKTWLELMEDFFNTAFQARDVIEKGTPEAKQKVLSKIGENFLLKDKILTFSFKKPYDILLKPEYRTNVLLGLDSNQNKRIQSPLSYH